MAGPSYAAMPDKSSKGLPASAPTEEESDAPSLYPVHVGGGWYELSDGTRVQGKEEAEAEEAGL